jgi:hypothetical protein
MVRWHPERWGHSLLLQHWILLACWDIFPCTSTTNSRWHPHYLTASKITFTLHPHTSHHITLHRICRIIIITSHQHHITLRHIYITLDRASHIRFTLGDHFTSLFEIKSLLGHIDVSSSHHITSHPSTSCHITSHHITSHHIITSHHVRSHHITSHLIARRYYLWMLLWQLESSLLLWRVNHRGAAIPGYCCG